MNASKIIDLANAFHVEVEEKLMVQMKKLEWNKC